MEQGHVRLPGPWGRALRAALSLVLAVAMCVPAGFWGAVGGVQEAEAANDKTVEVVDSGIDAHFGDWGEYSNVLEDKSTNNKIICIDPDKTRAPSGTYTKHYKFWKYFKHESKPIQRRYMARAITYYINPSSKFKDDSMLPDKDWNDDNWGNNAAYSVCHICESLLFGNDSWLQGYWTGTSKKFQNWVLNKITGGYFGAMPSDGKYKPNSVFGKLLGGDANGKVDVTDSNKYFAEVGSSNSGAFRLYVVSTAEGKQNYVGFDEAEMGYVGVHKALKAVGNSGSNGLYSPEGAVYGVYGSKDDAKNDEDVIQELVTGPQGNRCSEKLPIDDYYIKETEAPDYLEPDDKIYEVTAVASEDDVKDALTNNTRSKAVAGAIADSTDKPMTTTMDFLLKKVRQDDQEEPVPGAVFDVEQFGNLEWSGGAISTWTFTSQDDGKVYFTSDGTKNGEKVKLTAGSYRVTETQAPAGFNTVGPFTFTVSLNDKKDGLSAAGDFTDGDNPVRVDPIDRTVMEPIKHGGLVIGKADRDVMKDMPGSYDGEDGETVVPDGAEYGMMAQGDASLVGAEFQVKWSTKNSGNAKINGVEYAPGYQIDANGIRQVHANSAPMPTQANQNCSAISALILCYRSHSNPLQSTITCVITDMIIYAIAHRRKGENARAG